ncbi:hypothetical protein Q1695_006997 [Nippostrongylus brasiliensis]|nr:hypothetical protein Q1695_006997 [Nippostrongylus brasiliensis]
MISAFRSATFLLIFDIAQAQFLAQQQQSTTSATNRKYRVRVGISAVEDPTGSVGWSVSGGAVGLAIDRLREMNVASDFDFELNVSYTTCNASDAVGDSIAFMKNYSVDAIIAAPCRDASVVMAHLSTTYSKLLLVWGYVPELSATAKFPWLTTIVPSAQPLGASVVEVLKTYNWNRVAMMYTLDAFDYCTTIIDAIWSYTSDASINVVVDSAVNVNDDAMMTEALEHVRKHARIILLCFNSDADRRKFLLKVAAMDMTGDEYQYILAAIRNIGFVNSGLTPFWETVNSTVNDTKDEVVKDAALKLLIIDVSSDVKEIDLLKKFNENVMDRIRQPPLNCNQPECLNNTGKLIGRYARHLFDLFFLYGMALQAAGSQYTNISRVNAEMMTSFSGLTGEVKIDEFNRRVPIFFLYGLDNHANQVAFMQIDLNKGSPVAKMLYNDEKTTLFANRDGVRPLQVPLCGFDGLKCPATFILKNLAYFLIAAGILICAVFLLILLSIVVCVNRAREAERIRSEWLISSALLVKPEAKATTASRMSTRSSSSYFTTQRTFESECFEVRYYLNETVLVAKYPKLELNSTESSSCTQLLRLDHDNVNKFLGISLDGPEFMMVFRMCERGSLQSIVCSGNLTDDPFFVLCLLKDIASGLNYIHHSFLQYVGSLTSATCLVSQGWQVKLSDYGLSTVIRPKSQYDLLWAAPEQLRNPAIRGSKGADIYSFAIICSEVSTGKPAWRVAPQGKYDEILHRVKRGGVVPYRPDLNGSIADQPLTSLITKCWSEEEGDRPRSEVVHNKFVELMQKERSGHLMDHMFEMLEDHTQELEKEVERQSKELQEQKREADILLRKMLPGEVAERLKRGQSVDPESFDSVTVFFADVVKFTQLSAKCSPLQVVALLNELYSSFDSIIEKNAAYKVESIGDGYLCVSGLPKRNGFNHIRDIAEMSLDFLDYVAHFRVPGLPSEKIELRIGINSGSCVAGVVGLSMPRYCLFGDTVNTASRMESNGKPSRIHISATAHDLLMRNFPGCYVVSSRGEIIIKGKGVMETFWLDGRTEGNAADEQ